MMVRFLFRDPNILIQLLVASFTQEWEILPKEAGKKLIKQLLDTCMFNLECPSLCGTCEILLIVDIEVGYMKCKN
jgi:hypothetical protein